MELTCWNYTKEEWTNFRRWKTRQKGLLFFVFRKLFAFKRQPVPEVRIMNDKVWVNNVHEPFQNGNRQFKEIHIRETGSLNILEINYEQDNNLHGISILIPKGKLREAIIVQERLNGQLN